MRHPPASDAHMTGPQMLMRFGGISEMTLWRWLRDPTLNFPKPLVINRRRYWRVVDIEKWERDQATGKAAA